MPRWRFRLASRFLLALAILVLQQGALTHALAHPLEPAKPHGGKHCELCLAFASADAEAAPPAGTPLVVSGPLPAPTHRAASSPRAHRFSAFASRAPPALP